jgi:mRNA interferase HigB
VRIISQKVLQEFWGRHPDSEQPLRQWFRTALSAEWRSLIDVRRIYPHADAVETRRSGILTVFNVCGNKYRLVVRIRYDWQLINARCVLTHAEYNRGKWKD